MKCGSHAERPDEGVRSLDGPEGGRERIRLDVPAYGVLRVTVGMESAFVMMLRCGR